MRKTLSVIIAVLLFVTVMAMVPAHLGSNSNFHSAEEIKLFRAQQRIMDPIAPGEYFLTPSNCKGCHGMDPLAIANVDASGKDINLFDDWETSMMGLSAADPLWRAKVSHEMLVNPADTTDLQNFCTSCHAPMGHYSAYFKGLPHYSISDLINDSLGKSGVACLGCHMIGPDSLGLTFSGKIPYDTNKVAYGPFDNPMTGPMQLYIGFTPVKSDHMNEARMCSPCHTLQSNTVDLNGLPTANVFVEQSTYHEYLNSSYPANTVTCQTCHMPQVEDPIKIAVGYTALPGRSPFNLHQFAGANLFMLNLIKTNKSSLGIAASDANFDSTIAVTEQQLKQNSLIINAQVDTIHHDTAFISVTLINKAGHKFPSGYPSRRAVLQMIVNNGTDTLFASGRFDANDEVIFNSPVFEPHYNIITDENQAQIYEMVMGDVNGNKTTVLTRGSSKLKDNRIPPLGFSTQHYTYDTAYIAGNALNDPDFNKNGINEGTGRDIVHYHVPLNGYTGPLSLKANVFYQAVPPSWVAEMFSYNSAPIDTFRNMYNNADKSPFLMVSDSLQFDVLTGLDNTINIDNLYAVFPNPTTTGKVNINGNSSNIISIRVYNLRGQTFNVSLKIIKNDQAEIQLPSVPGVYFLQINTTKGSTIKKILRI